MSHNARSRRWKIRHVRPNDSLRAVNQVLARMVPNDTIGQTVPSPKDAPEGGLLALLEGPDSQFILRKGETLRAFGPFGMNGAWVELPFTVAKSWTALGYLSVPFVVASGLFGDETVGQIQALVKGMRMGGPRIQVAA